MDCPNSASVVHKYGVCQAMAWNEIYYIYLNQTRVVWKSFHVKHEKFNFFDEYYYGIRAADYFYKCLQAKSTRIVLMS